MVYKNINVNYVFYDNKSKINLVYLHGWGQNIDMMMGIAKPFIKRHNVQIIVHIHKIRTNSIFCKISYNTIRKSFDNRNNGQKHWYIPNNDIYYFKTRVFKE